MTCCGEAVALVVVAVVVVVNKGRSEARELQLW